LKNMKKHENRGKCIIEKNLKPKKVILVLNKKNEMWMITIISIVIHNVI
jgi:hypothetical protein